MKKISLMLGFVLLLTGCIKEASVKSNTVVQEVNQASSNLFSKEFKETVLTVSPELLKEIDVMEMNIHRYKVLSKSCEELERDFQNEQNISKFETKLYQEEIDDCYQDSRRNTLNLVSINHSINILDLLKMESKIDESKYRYLKKELNKIAQWVNSKMM